MTETITLTRTEAEDPRATEHAAFIAYLSDPGGHSLSESATELPAGVDPADGASVVSWAIAHWDLDDDADRDWIVAVEEAVGGAVPTASDDVARYRHVIAA